MKINYYYCRSKIKDAGFYSIYYGLCGHNIHSLLFPYFTYFNHYMSTLSGDYQDNTSPSVSILIKQYSVT